MRRKQQKSVAVTRKYTRYIHLFSDKVLRSKINDMLLLKIVSPNLCDTNMRSNYQCREKKMANKDVFLLWITSSNLYSVFFNYQSKQKPTIIHQKKNNQNKIVICLSFYQNTISSFELIEKLCYYKISNSYVYIYKRIKYCMIVKYDFYHIVICY